MKLAYVTKPRPYQVRVLKRMIKQRGGGIQVPMRWGKTWVAIHWACALHRLEDVDRVLVITVTSGLGVWEDQIAQHCPLPWRVLSHHGELLAEGPGGAWDGTGDSLEFMLVNYQNVYARAYIQGREWVTVTNSTLHKFEAQAIVADESHHLGNPTAEQTKHACSLARPIPHRLFMTGTMFHRKPFFVFGQFKWYDDGRTFGTSFTQFKNRIAIFRDLQGFVLLRYRNLSWMMKRVRPVVHIETKVPKIPTVKNRIRFPLTGRNLEVYRQMERHRVLRIGGETLIADVVLTQHLWLMMIAGGFVKLPEKRKYIQVGNDKLLMAEDRMREYLEQDITKVVVACRFVPELAAMAKVAKKLGFKPIMFHGGVPKGRERHRRTQLFQKWDGPAAFISQIATGKESIDLSAADTILWYSLTQSYVEFDQFGDRIKKFDDPRTLMHDFLIAKGTRDEVTLEAMRLKMNVTEYLQTNPKRAEEIVAMHAGKH